MHAPPRAQPGPHAGPHAVSCSRLRCAQHAVVRHTFASFFAHLLRGYQDVLVVRPARGAFPDTQVDLPALLASRSAAEGALLRQLQHTHTFTRFLEQRSSFSSRLGEYVLFDSLADQCATTPHGESAALPALPATTQRDRVYNVLPPQPATDDATLSPYKRWPTFRPNQVPLPRLIPPFNFAAAPIRVRGHVVRRANDTPATLPPFRTGASGELLEAKPSTREASAGTKPSGLHRTWDVPAPRATDASAQTSVPALAAETSPGTPRVLTAGRHLPPANALRAALRSRRRVDRGLGISDEC
jgi:hypothetical protein